jgi:hypothetical protein
MFGRMIKARALDALVRVLLALFSLVVMLYPDDTVAMAAAVIVALATFYGTYRHRLIARPKSTLDPMPVS